MGLDAQFDADVFDSIMEHCSEAAFTVRRETGKLLTANMRLAELTGRSRAWLVGTDVSQLVPWDETVCPLQILERPGLHEEVPMLGADGYPVSVALTVAFVRDPQAGELAACIARDTTERKLIERELIAKHTALHAAHAEVARVLARAEDTNRQLAQRNRELSQLTAQLCEADRRVLIGELSAGLAHSLNNPLGAVESAQRQLAHQIRTRAEKGLARDCERLFSRATEALARTEEIIRTIRRAHRAGRTMNKVGSLSLRQEIEAALALFSDRLGGVDLRLDIDDDDTVRAAAGDVQHILWNLLDNALQAMPNGGVVEIGVTKAANDTVLSIQDTGPGLSDRVAERLFDPFVTTRASGTGLGLYVAKRLSEPWGGDLVHKPTEGGARFELTFRGDEENAA